MCLQLQFTVAGNIEAAFQSAFLKVDNSDELRWLISDGLRIAFLDGLLTLRPNDIGMIHKNPKASDLAEAIRCGYLDVEKCFGVALSDNAHIMDELLPCDEAEIGSCANVVLIKNGTIYCGLTFI